MLWRGDAEGRCVYLNRALREFWGVADIETFSWSSTLVEADGPQVFGPFSEGMAAQTGFRCEGRYYRADGAIRILETVATPRFENGVFMGMVGVNTDITEQREAEARATLLLHEMTHRVKNSLATVQSIAMQTARSSPSLEAFSEAFEARIAALARTHDLLTGAAHERADLREVLEAELGPYGAAGDRRLSLSGAPVRLDAGAAVNLALVIHELATNAAKYGAYAGAGSLAVTWTEEVAGKVVLDWRESGGPKVTPPTATGFGSRLVRRLLTGELGGSYEASYEVNGLVARLRFRSTQSGATV